MQLCFVTKLCNFILMILIVLLSTSVDGVLLIIQEEKKKSMSKSKEIFCFSAQHCKSPSFVPQNFETKGHFC